MLLIQTLIESNESDAVSTGNDSLFVHRRSGVRVQPGMPDAPGSGRRSLNLVAGENRGKVTKQAPPGMSPGWEVRLLKLPI